MIVQETLCDPQIPKRAHRRLKRIHFLYPAFEDPNAFFLGDVSFTERL